MFDNLTDVELCILWNATNVSHVTIDETMPTAVAPYFKTQGFSLWSAINTECKARKLNPETMTRSVVVTQTVQEGL